MNTQSDEQRFATGQSGAEVVRVSDTVRKTPGKNAEFTNAVLKTLEEKGFSYSPRYLGTDQKGRSVITYIEGSVITDEVLNLELSIEAIKALRSFHDIFAGSELAKNQETICHKDFAPWNVLQLEGKIVGIIDFDDVYPGKRITDLAYACWTFLDLGDASTGTSTSTQIEEVKILVRAYGEVDTMEFISELLNSQNRVLGYRQKLAENAKTPDEKKERIKRCELIEASIKWVKDNEKSIVLALDEI